MKSLLAALVLGASIAAPAHALAPEPHATAPRTSELDALVASLVPDDAMIDLALRAFDYSMEAGGDAQAKALYARYPGLREHVAAKLRPEMTRILKRALPGLRTQIKGILAAEFTPAEVADTAAFFGSATGRKVYANALRSIGDKPDRSEADVNAAATASVMASLAPEDMPAMMKFATSSAAAKMNSVNPKIAAASKAWANKLVAANRSRIQKIAKRATAKYVAKAKRGKA